MPVNLREQAESLVRQEVLDWQLLMDEKRYHQQVLFAAQVLFDIYCLPGVE